jgi:TetR/AcrR family fatty acid metabolism transcriptional regulator
MLRIYVIQHLTSMKKNRNLAEVIQIELRQTNKVIKEYRDNKFSAYVGIVGDIIQRGQETGFFREDVQPDIAKRIIFGSLDEVSRVWNTSLETHYSVEEISNQVLTIFLRGMLVTPSDH